MRAAVYTDFKGPLEIRDVPIPTAPDDGVTIEVKATGLCRSDWHGWMGHDPDIKCPHVPGHEFAGIVSSAGSRVNNFQTGDRVTVPFVCGCGHCEQCATGNQQICDNQTQPGFTHWGSFAEFVAVFHADENLVKLPDTLSFESAATLGCRFITSFRGLVDQGELKAGQWVAIHGCGGVGLSAVMIATALKANVIAIDINNEKLAFAKKMGAMHVMNASENNIPQAIQSLCGGVHISMDAFGSQETCAQSISSLRKQGKHIQIGLLGDQNPEIPMDQVVAKELNIIGSHGMQAHRYPQIFDMIAAGELHPELLVRNKVSLLEASTLITKMDEFKDTGVTVITDF